LDSTRFYYAKGRGLQSAPHLRGGAYPLLRAARSMRCT
jgi:hypothetical protein